MGEIKIVLLCLALYILPILIIKFSNKICKKFEGKSITDFDDVAEIYMCFVPLFNYVLAVIYFGFTLLVLALEGVCYITKEKGKVDFKDKVRKVLS